MTVLPAADPATHTVPVRFDLALALGALAETVNVVAETTLLQTEKADLSTELTAKAELLPIGVAMTPPASSWRVPALIVVRPV